MKGATRQAAERFEAMATFLADPATHGGAETRRIDTHTAAVVLAGARAWKLRRPVDYGWLDYSTRARRRLFAEREIAWNAPAAPGLYLGLGGIAGAPGAFRLIGPGEAVPEAAEPLVVMQRFPEEALFDRMAAEGRLTPELMRATGRAVADMHKRAPARPGPGRLPEFARAEASELTRLAPILGEEAVARFTRLLRARAGALADLAAARGARRCHGDLHLRNIVLWQGRPAPFDCIEFNDAFTDIDPLYDLAFLLMDLDHRAHRELAVEVLNSWAERMAAEPGAEVETAYGGLALLPFHLACRAAIRAKVGALTLEARGDTGDGAAGAEARAYLALALSYLEAARAPRLIAIGGLSGTGKTTLARALAARLAARPGAFATGVLVIRSDALRKGMWGVEEEERLPPEAYAPEVSARVYAEMRRRAALALGGGAVVILDAVHLRPEERAAAEAVAREAGVPFAGLWLEAPPERLKARVEARVGDASDADARVVEMQRAFDPGPITWPRLGTGGPLEAVVEAAVRAAAEAASGAVDGKA